MSLQAFSTVPVGCKFRYDGETFKKTATGEVFDPPNPNGGLAWSYYDGRRHKEWAFQGDERVVLCD